MKPTEYIASDRRGHEAHDLELEALRDPFLAEALEGLESADADHAAAVASLERRIAARTARDLHHRRLMHIRRVTAAAAALIVLAAAGILTWRKAPVADLSNGVETLAGNRPAAADTLADTTQNRKRDTAVLAATTPALAETPSVTPLPADRASAAGLSSVTTADAPGRSAPAPTASAAGTGTAGSAAPPTQTAAPRPTALSTGSLPTKSGKSGKSANSTATCAAPEPDREERETSQSAPEGLGPGSEVPLEEVVVVAYGTAHKSDFTGSAGAVSRDEPGTVDTETGPARPRDTQSDPLPHPAHTAEDRPFLTAETMPRFQGGDLRDFRRWVQARIRKPEIALENGIQGRVVVSFTIDTLGRLTDIRVLQTPDRSLSDEAVRVLKSSPRWEPGRQGEKKKRVKYTMPVDFRRQN